MIIKNDPNDLKGPTSSAAYEVQQIITKVLPLRIKKQISGVLLELRMTQKLSERLCDDLEVELLCYIQKVDKDLQVPLTWWDHFKLTYFKGKLLEKFPVQYRTIHARVLFPDMPVDLARTTNTISYIKRNDHPY